MKIQDQGCSSLRVALLLWMAGVLSTPGIALAQETALDRYIAKPDPTYSWKLVNTIPGKGYTGFVIDLTSQSWRSAAEVDRPAWKHWLTIVKPDKVTSAGWLRDGNRNRDC
jgi:PhoPQ-activated pathogenicity-related protein